MPQTQQVVAHEKTTRRPPAIVYQAHKRLHNAMPPRERPVKFKKIPTLHAWQDFCPDGTDNASRLHKMMQWDQLHMQILMNGLNVAAGASEHRFHLEINFVEDHECLRNITVKLTYGDQCVLTFHHNDMVLMPFTNGEKPFNWIATIPLDFRTHPNIDVSYNNQRQQFVIAKQISVFQAANKKAIAAVIFVDSKSCANDHAIYPEALARVAKTGLIKSIGRFENMLNCGMENPFLVELPVMITLFEKCDQWMQSFEDFVKNQKQVFELDESSSIFNCMKLNRTSLALVNAMHGNISHDNVIKSIDFSYPILAMNKQKFLTLYTAEKKNDHVELTKNQFVNITTINNFDLTLANLVNALYTSPFHVFNNVLTELIAFRHDIFALCKEEQKEKHSQIMKYVYMTMHVTDNMLMDIIETIGQTQSILHGSSICLAALLILRPVQFHKTTMQLTGIHKKVRMATKLVNTRNTEYLFHKIHHPICKHLGKMLLVNTIEAELKNRSGYYRDDPMHSIALNQTSRYVTKGAYARRRDAVLCETELLLCPINKWHEILKIWLYFLYLIERIELKIMHHLLLMCVSNRITSRSSAEVWAQDTSHEEKQLSVEIGCRLMLFCLFQEGTDQEFATISTRIAAYSTFSTTD